MKALSELGISPYPWDSHNQFVTANDDGSVVAATNVRDARLIAAAPELYFHLHAALLLCGMRKCVSDNTLSLWRSALAKASGEEVNND